MNAASYFSLNFYDPVNKLLAKYDARKVFLEGDAIIVAQLEREGEARLGVSRTCVLAWEIVSLLHGYNELLKRSGLPSMEVGLGISRVAQAGLQRLEKTIAGEPLKYFLLLVYERWKKRAFLALCLLFDTPTPLPPV